MQLKASHWVEIIGGGIMNYQTFLLKGKDSFFRFEWMGECWGAGNLCLGLRPRKSPTKLVHSRLKACRGRQCGSTVHCDMIIN